MIKKIITLKLIIISFISFNAQALELFKAEYQVFKDAKLIGDSSIELTKDDRLYSIIDKTNGTHGMASFLGFKRSEVTFFTEENNKLLPQSYSMNQKVAFNKRKSDYRVDQNNLMAYGKYKDKNWELNITDLFLTPNLVSLKLFSDVCSNKKNDFNYPVLKRGKIQNYQFKITSQKNNIIVVDKIHSKPSRITTMWLDVSKNCLPIRTYHIEEGEDSLETKLTQITNH